MLLPRVINVQKSNSIPAETIKGVKFGAQNPLPEPAQSYWTPAENTEYQFRSNPNPRPGAYKRSRHTGEIVMTDYERSTETKTFQIAKLDHELMRTAIRRASLPTECTVFETYDLYTRWSEQGDYHSWTDRVPEVYASELASDSDIRSAIEANQTAALAAARSGYDILTEYAERLSTLRFLNDLISSADDKLRSFVSEDTDGRGRYLRKSTAKQLLLRGDDAAKRWASRWLAYRYALMPLIYSVQDVLEVVREAGNRYNTERRNTFWSYLTNEVSREGTQVISFPLGSSKVSSIVKSMYTNEGLERRVYQALTTNPFNTAWELVPFSFVVDWFVNVGDYIMAVSGVDLSSQEVACNVTKHDYEIISLLSRKGFVETGTKSQPFGSCGPVDTTYRISYDEQHPLRTVRKRSYVRKVSPRMEPHLVVDPDLNWARGLDSVALTYLATRKRMRNYLR